MKLLLTLLIVAISYVLTAQSIPNKINYQAVAHDVNGDVLSNQALNVTISILSGSASGTVEYEEIHSVNTNDYGLFYFEIGTGVVNSGSMAGVNWSGMDHFLNVNVAGNNLGTTQLVSVPYALASKNTSGINGTSINTGSLLDGNVLVYNGTSGQWQSQAPATGGTNGSNSITTAVSEPAGANCVNGGSFVEFGTDVNNNSTLDGAEVSGSYFVCNGIDGVNGTDGIDGLNGTNGADGNTWTIGTGAATGGVNPGDMYLDVATNDYYSFDGSIWNLEGNLSATENITTLTDNGDGTFTYLSEAATSVIFDANIDDLDADPNNEYNSNFSINGTSDSLIIDDLGTHFAVALSDIQGTETTLYNIDGTLTGPRVVTIGGNTLDFNTSVANGFRVNSNTFNIDGASNSIGIGTSPSIGKVHLQHLSTTTNPALNIMSPNGTLNRMHFRNTTTPNKFWEIGAGTNVNDALSGWTVSYEDGAGNYNYHLAVYGDGKVAIGDSINNFNSSIFDVFGSATIHDTLSIRTDHGQGYSFPVTDGAPNFVMQTNGTGSVSWVDPYSFGGGAFATVGNITTNSPGDFTNDDFVFGSTSLADDTDPNHDSRMFFDKSKSSFRAGLFDAGDADANVGSYSFATGVNTRADGDYSFATGAGSRALGNNSVAMGIASSANNVGSMAFGTNVTASGDNTMVFGLNSNVTGTASYVLGEQLNVAGNESYSIGKQNTVSGNNSVGIGQVNSINGDFSYGFGDDLVTNTYMELALGYWNTSFVGSTVAWVPTDRLFSIGNGQSPNRSDALVMLKDGSTRLNGTLTLDADNTGALNGYTFPGQDGTTNYVMQTDGLGTVSWVDPSMLTSSDTLSIIKDSDGNTSVETAIGDFIDFNLAGIQQFRMDGPRIAFLNPEQSVYLGDLAGNSHIAAAYDNVFVGNGAGQLNTSINNTAVGRSALNQATTADNNIAIGYESQFNTTTGSQNVAVGGGSLGAGNGGFPMTGGQNTAIGLGALYANTTGDANVSLGLNSLFINTTGYNNTAIGYGSLAENTTGSGLTAIGFDSDVVGNNLTNATAIGYNTVVSQSNSLVLGNGANVGIGTTAPSEMLYIQGSDADLDLETNDDLESTSFHLRRSRLTGVTRTVPLFGDYLANIQFQGYNGATYSNGAIIEGRVDGNPGAGDDMPAKLVFHTNPGGVIGAQPRMTIKSSGNVGIGTENPVASVLLDVNGSIGMSNDADKFVRIDEGTDLIPVAYGVINDGAIMPNASTTNFTVTKLSAGSYQVTYVGPRTFAGLGEFQLSLAPYYQGTTLIATYQYLGGKSFEIFLTDLGDVLTDGIVSFTLRLK